MSKPLAGNAVLLPLSPVRTELAKCCNTNTHELKAQQAVLIQAKPTECLY
jgi:hypothetical protein